MALNVFKYMCRFLLIFFLLLDFLFVSAQSPTAVISGKIRDKQGAPIEYANVVCKGTQLMSTTDVNGQFQLQVPSGNHLLLISRVGYQELSQKVSVVKGQYLDLDILFLLDSKDMDEVQVFGKTENTTRKEQSYNVSIIDAKKLYNHSVSLNQVLNTTAGIRIREDGGVGSNFSFSLNGFSGKQVKFFLDGIPMDNFGSSLALNNFPVNMAERIEVYKGVLPIHLGADALGGAVNVITRSNPNFLDVSYGFGSFNTHKASVNHAYTHASTGFTLRTNAFYNYSDNNYKVHVSPIILSGSNAGQRAPEQAVKRFHDGYESATFQMEAGLTGKKFADQLLLGVILSGNDKDIQTGVVMDQVFGARTTRSTSLIPTLKYKKIDLFAKGLDLNLFAAYNLSQNRFIDTTRVKYNWLQETIPTSTAELLRTRLKNEDHDGLVNANATYRFGAGYSLGLNYLLTDFDRKSSDVEDPNNVTHLFPQKLKKQVIGLAWQYQTARFTGTLFSKFYNLDAQSFEPVTNGTGVPTYTRSEIQKKQWGYGGAAAYFILPKLQGKVSFEHSYRLPEATELLGDGLYTRRNAALKPESSNNLNLGALYAFKVSEQHHFGLEASYIYRNSKDYIRLDQAQAQPIDRQYINIGDVLTQGVEAEVNYRWKNKFNASVNVTYQNIVDKQKFFTSTNLTGTITTPNLGYNYRISNIPFLFGNASVGYTFSQLGHEKNDLNIQYSLNFIEKYYLTPNHLGANNTDLIPGQWAHNLSANYGLQNGKYNIALECRNLTDAKLFDNYKLQKPSRAVFVKLRYFISK